MTHNGRGQACGEEITGNLPAYLVMKGSRNMGSKATLARAVREVLRAAGFDPARNYQSWHKRCGFNPGFKVVTPAGRGPVVVFLLADLPLSRSNPKITPAHELARIRKAEVRRLRDYLPVLVQAGLQVELLDDNIGLVTISQDKTARPRLVCRFAER